MSLLSCGYAAKKKIPSHQLRCFSNSQERGKTRIGLTLYRQLIAWCKGTDSNIPLSHFIPPITLQPPRIDEQALQSLAETGAVEINKVQQSSFPPGTSIHADKLSSPIQSSNDLLSFFRGIFRLNAREQNPEAQKEHISLAFDTLRSLNELSEALNDLEKKREAHKDRENVKFRIGHVVKHQIEDWRGVVAGWERIEESLDDDSEGKSTSLTNKTYKLDQNIRVTVLLDSGDAHMHYLKRREPGNMSSAEVFESDLSLVENESLCRLRSTHISANFSHFDSKSRTFVPNKLKLYEYPADQVDELQRQSDCTVDNAANEIVSAVKALAESLAKNSIRAILNEKSAQDSGDFKLIAFFLDQLTALSSGEIVSTTDAEHAPQNRSPDKLAVMYIQQLHNLVVEIGELLWKRRTSLDASVDNKFRVGEVVKHKVYGFRGVVVAWDPVPALDVSRWDGLQHITDPHKYPFYHIIPDQNDCIEAFGGERQSRYVCEENISLCPPGELRDIDIDLEPEWELDRSNMTYHPPADILFKYGGDMADDGLTERCLEAMKDEMSRLFVASRDNTRAGIPHIDAMAGNLSNENLFTLLKTADNMNDAVVISEILKEIWKSHIDVTLRSKLDTSISYLLGGKTKEAMLSLRELVAEDPGYAEAWNKISTCEFMLGKMDDALASAQKTLSLIPTHYQALNGMGLVHYERNDIPLAIENFQKSLELDPWSPVSSRLATCLDADVDTPKVG